MSFKLPYRSYAPGDLFYGLGWQRATLMQALCTPTNGGMPHGSKLGWIDLFLVPINQLITPEARLTNDGFADTLINHSKYRVALDHTSKIGIEGNSAWRAKSKGGLYWATQIASKHVHFCLEGLDMHQVITKSYPGRLADGIGRDTPPNTPQTEKERSITGAELRWVYRWRNNSNVQNYIQFWRKDSFFAKQPNDPTKGFRQCAPPWAWKKYEATWAGYQPKQEY